MMGFPEFPDSVVKNPPANAGDVGSFPWSKRSSGEEMANHSSILTWEISWAEISCSLASYSPWDNRVRHMSDWAHTHTQNTHSKSLPSETFLSVQLNSGAHFDATYFASLNSHTLPVTSKDIKSFIHDCRNHSSEMKNLSDVLFCPLHPLTPLFQAIILLGSRANGHS